MRHAVELLLQEMRICSPNRCSYSRNSCTPQPRGRTRRDRCVRAQVLVWRDSEFRVKLEEITLSEQPTTPAPSKKYLPAEFGSDYMTFAHQLGRRGLRTWTTFTCSSSPWIMDHLVQTYDIDARYLISVHDGLRHLVAERDLHRAALALQIANLWT